MKSTTTTEKKTVTKTPAPKRLNRYQRAARIIHQTVAKTGKMPTKAQLAKRGKMQEITANRCLQAYTAFLEVQNIA